MNSKIITQDLDIINEVISSYSSSPPISVYTRNSITSFKEKDLEVFKYNCENIVKWYSQNINKIRSNPYVTNFDSHVAAFEKIKNILNELHLHEENFMSYFNSSDKKSSPINTDPYKVFIVHGRDKLAETEVTSFLRKLDLVPIVLHSEPNLGNTIIEKIENNSNVGFAIVLYTPCDEGRLIGDELQFRARQNVVFEHGYLIGKIGRKRVLALVKGQLEKIGRASCRERV